MTITRIRCQPSTAPLTAFDRLSDEMNQMFDWSFGGRRLGGNFVISDRIPVDVIEESEQFRVRADLPGMAKEDIQVTLEGNTLSLHAERKGEVNETKDGYRRTERSFGSFSRRLVLPTRVDPEKIEATYKDGVLEVTVAKAESAKPRQIQIR